ncbi:hypothetical protein [Microcoleus sp. D2_18a_D3]|uniref:hypothetical protein n=1 Tax=Microcoleus sp. D2_18a_D3 TaxID=3055330 RepID=UPI002FD26B5D
MFRPLSAIIPEQIDWTTNGTLAGAMNISLTQLRRDAAVLKELELIRLQEGVEEIEVSESEETPTDKEVSPKRTRARRRKGFDRADSEIMWLFRQLVRERGRTKAIQSIHQIIEEFYHHERDR